MPWHRQERRTGQEIWSCCAYLRVVRRAREALADRQRGVAYWLCWVSAGALAGLGEGHHLSMREGACIIRRQAMVNSCNWHS
jgi:hypothetical protein